MQVSALFKTFSAGMLALALAACGGQQNAAPAAASAASDAASAASATTEKKEIVFGTTVGDFGDMVKEQIKPALEQKGYTVKLVEFTDYVRPNQALATGELDINVFQHKPYLDNFKAEHKLDIVEAFQVPTAPLGLYPGKLKSLDMKAAARQIRTAGGGIRGGAAVLRQEMSTLVAALRSADLTPSGWLTAGKIAVILRGAYDPAIAATHRALAAGGCTGIGVSFPAASSKRY